MNVRDASRRDLLRHGGAARPAQLDPAITMVFKTPNHPSYPSAHGCRSAAGGVLGALFPREA